MKRLLVILTISALPFLISACSKGESYRPVTAEDQRKLDRGSLSGSDGLIMFGGGEKDGKGGGSPLGVNSFLWRATLDTLSFMPLASADPFGGVIITDWYENSKAQGERFKITTLILGRELRSDGVRVSLFKQTKDAHGTWRDEPQDEALAHELEDTILTRARELKVSQVSK